MVVVQLEVDFWGLAYFMGLGTAKVLGLSAALFGALRGMCICALFPRVYVQD